MASRQRNRLTERHGRQKGPETLLRRDRRRPRATVRGGNVPGDGTCGKTGRRDGGRGRSDGPGGGTHKKRDPGIVMMPGPPEVRRRPTLPTGVSVPSARAGLTALFGMGRGGTPRLKPPRISLERSQQDSTHFHTEDFGLLVRVG